MKPSGKSTETIRVSVTSNPEILRALASSVVATGAMVTGLVVWLAAVSPSGPLASVALGIPSGVFLYVVVLAAWDPDLFRDAARTLRRAPRVPASGVS